MYFPFNFCTFSQLLSLKAGKKLPEGAPNIAPRTAVCDVIYSAARRGLPLSVLLLYSIQNELSYKAVALGACNLY